MFKNQEILFKLFLGYSLLLFEKILNNTLHLFVIQPFSHSTIKPNYLSLYPTKYLLIFRLIIPQILIRYLYFQFLLFKKICLAYKDKLNWADWFG